MISGYQCTSVFDLDSPLLIIVLEILDKNFGTIKNGLNGQIFVLVFNRLAEEPIYVERIGVPLPEIDDNEKSLLKG